MGKKIKNGNPGQNIWPLTVDSLWIPTADFFIHAGNENGVEIVFSSSINSNISKVITKLEP